MKIEKASKDIWFLIFAVVCIFDPSNTILGIKELIFLVFLLFNLKKFIKNFNPQLFLGSLFIGIIFPLFFFLVGMNDNNFSISVAMSTLKVFPLFFMVNFLLQPDMRYEVLLSKASYILIPLTCLIFLTLLTNNFENLTKFIGDYKNTFMVANRTFGEVSFLMIYYKTISFLLFGLAYRLSKQETIKFDLLTTIIVLILFLAASRAIYISAFLILIFHFYTKFFKKSTIKLYIFYVIGIYFSLLVIQPILSVFLSLDEPSNSIKFGFIKDYMHLWKIDSISLLTGNGIGSGIYTIERGLTYNLETTYLEILRIFGIFGSLFIFYILLYPLIRVILLSKKKHLNISHKYFLFAYLCFVFFVIPTNPLLLSSTGALIVSIAYSIQNKFQVVDNF